MESGPEIFDIREAAAFLGVHEQTVRRLARRGAIPAFKVGKDWRFRREAVVRWADGQRTEQKPAPLPSTEPAVVLIVDDDDQVRTALSRIASSVGCRAVTAHDGEAGLVAARTQSPRLVLLDLKMPGMTGPKFLHELRQTHPDLPVVIVTGYPDSQLMTEAMQYGPLLLVAKPFDPEHVKRSIALVLGTKEARAPS